MLNKINLLRFLIVVLLFSSIAIATETTWRHSGFEISGYDINGSSTYNLTEIRKIEFGWNTSIPAVSETSRAVMYYDDNQKRIMQSLNGGVYQAIVTNETVRPYSYSAANATGALPNASIPASAVNRSSDFGAWTNYSGSSTIVGWSSFTQKDIYYQCIGKTCFVQFQITGTSNSATTSFTLPYNARLQTLITSISYDNTVLATTPSRGNLPGSENVVTFYKDFGTTAWTASGTKQIIGGFFYETT